MMMMMMMITNRGSLTNSHGLGLATLLLSAAAAAACGPSRTGHATGDESAGRRFVAAIDASRAAAHEDQLEQVVAITSELPLTEPAGIHVSRFVPTADGFVVSDFIGSRVDMYSHTGRWAARIGRSGTTPGSYVFPTGIAALPGGQLAVLDFRPARISVFGPDRRFESSILYNRHRFAGVQLAHDSEANDFYVFGVRSDPGSAGHTTTLVHRLDAAGALTGSWGELPDAAHAPWASEYYDPVTAWSREGLLISFPFGNDIYRLGRDGTLTSLLKAYPDGYRAPSRAFGTRNNSPQEPPITHYRRFHEWRMHWTPIDGLAVVGDRLLVSVQTFERLRYRLELWSLQEKRLIRAVQTNSLVVGADDGGRVYFRKSADFNTEEPDVILVSTVR